MIVTFFAEVSTDLERILGQQLLIEPACEQTRCIFKSVCVCVCVCADSKAINACSVLAEEGI